MARRRPEPPQAEQMWLRLVTGRPGSAVTIEWLTWISAQRAAQGYSLAVELGQRLVAPQLRRTALAAPAPAAGEAGRRGRARRGLPMAEQKSMAQPH